MAQLLGALVTPAEDPTCTLSPILLFIISATPVPEHLLPSSSSSIVAHRWHIPRESGQCPHKYNLKRNKMSLILFIPGKLNHNGNRHFLTDFNGKMSRNYFWLGQWMSINQSSYSPSFLCFFSFLLQTTTNVQWFYSYLNLNIWNTSWEM